MHRAHSRFKACALTVLMAITTVSPTYSLVNQTLSEEEQQQKAAQAYLDTLLNESLDILKKIDSHLQDLAAMINNKQLPKIKNKEEVTQHITQLRIMVKNILNEAFVQVTLEDVLGIIFFVRTLENLMITAGKNSFTDLTHLNLEDMAPKIDEKRFNPENLPQFIAEEHHKNIQLSQDIEYYITNAGIGYWNKLWRTLDGYVMEPYRKYNLGKWGATIGATAFGSLLWKRWIDTETRDKRRSHEFQIFLAGKPAAGTPFTPSPADSAWSIDGLRFNLPFFGERTVLPALGEHPVWGPHGIENMEHLGTVGHVQALIGNFDRNMPLLRLIFTYYLLKNYTDIYDSVGPKISRLASHMLNSFKGGIFNKKAEEYLDSIEARYTFDDLIGADEVKEVFSFIIDYMLDPESFERAGIRPPKAYLFSGKTRTGKTYSAEAIAGQINLRLKQRGQGGKKIQFFTLEASELNQIGLKKIMATAKIFAPCIIFIDEIDLLNLNRCGDTRTLSEFLTTLSGCMEVDPDKQVVIIGATNKPENIDHALRQNGRFGKEIRFELPGFTHRKAYLIRELKKRSVDLATFNIDRLAQETEGASFEQLGIMLSAALQKAKLRGCALSYEFIEEAFDQEIRNIITHPSKQLSDAEKRIIAVHQAGHVLANTLLKTHRNLAKVTIKPMLTKLKDEMVWSHFEKKADVQEEEQKKIEYGKMFTYHTDDTLDFENEEELIKQCKVLLAGRIAQKIVLGTASNYNAHDQEHALTLTKRIALEGMNPEQLTRQQLNKVCDKALALLEQCEQEVTALLEANRATLEHLAQALESHETLTAQQVHELIAQK